MVNLTSILHGRGPHLIYGVKRGKVPTKLRPTVVATKTFARNLKASKTKSDNTWTPTEVNEVLKTFTALKGPRDH
ncbi:hypothetical protein QZH41_018363 [Actinostola sp. cb2023]|nr:hypothetical protein QZH41_018363 [Actinostola sp. cb2023]